jgi:hypothetical protein
MLGGVVESMSGVGVVELMSVVGSVVEESVGELGWAVSVIVE